MTGSQYGATGEPVCSGGGPEAQAVEAVVATVDAVQTNLKEGQDAAAGMAQQWVGRMAGIPFTALSGGGVDSVMSGRMWADCTVEMIDTLLAVQRRSVERLITAQCRTAGLMAESGMVLATSGWRAVAGASGPGAGHGSAS